MKLLRTSGPAAIAHFRLLALAAFGLIAEYGHSQFVELHQDPWFHSYAIDIASNGNIVGVWNPENPETRHHPFFSGESGQSWYSTKRLSPRAISTDGRAMVGLGYSGAFRLRDNSLEHLGRLAPERSSQANDTNFDGSVVIGDATLENYESAAFRWEDGVGMTRIGVPGEWWSRADKVTPDGRYVVGAYRNAAGIRTFLWNDESGGRDIGPQRQSSGRGSGACLTDDGATVYTTTGPNEEGNLSRWTEEAGMIDLGLPMSYVSDCTFDGEIVIGSDNGVGKLYEAGVGMFDLDDWLARYGVEVPARFSIFSPASIVKRGSNISIVGTAKEYDYNTYRYYSEAFVATVPEPLSVVPLAIGAGVLLLRRRRRLPEALQ